MLVNINFPGQLQWRSHEHAGAEDAFGKVVDVPNLPSPLANGCDAIRWFPPSEEIGPAGYRIMQDMRNNAPPKAWHINDVYHYLTMHDKLAAFERWQLAGIPHPRWFEVGHHDRDGVERVYTSPLPLLIRVNNSVAGFNSILVRNREEIGPALLAIDAACTRDRANGRGVNNRMFCVEYINTRRPEHPLNVSYRIIVAGGNVVTGYARVSDPQDWVAVTNKFHSGLADAWLFFNRRCQEIMTTHADLLVKAMAVTGMNHQGLDVIEDGTTGQLYFLETQTTYDAGFIGAGPYTPPYYNPYNPELVKFIKENHAMLEREIPLYVHAWLDKREHFRQCYANLAEQMKNQKAQ